MMEQLLVVDTLYKFATLQKFKNFAKKIISLINMEVMILAKCKDNICFNVKPKFIF